MELSRKVELWEGCEVELHIGAPQDAGITAVQGVSTLRDYRDWCLAKVRIAEGSDEKVLTLPDSELFDLNRWVREDCRNWLKDLVIDAAMDTVFSGVRIICRSPAKVAILSELLELEDWEIEEIVG